MLSPATGLSVCQAHVIAVVHRSSYGRLELLPPLTGSWATAPVPARRGHARSL